jgi:hypothetical protein
MSDEKLSAAASRLGAGDATRRDARPGEAGQGEGRPAMRRTVGVYERPARRRLSLSLVVILILSALVSVVAAARFLF